MTRTQTVKAADSLAAGRLTQGFSSWGVLALGFLALTALALSSKGIFLDDYLQDLRLPTATLAVDNPRESLIGPLGQAFYWPYQLFSGGDFVAKDILHTNLFMAWIVGLGAFALVRRLTKDWIAVCVGLSAFAVAASPREIGTLELISYLAPYNRWGWAILAPIAFYALTPKAVAVKEQWGRLALVGVGLFFLLFMKITYFGAGCVALGAGVALGLLRLRAALIVALVVATGCLILELGTHSLAAYADGIRMSLHAGSEVQTRVEEHWFRRNLLVGEGLRYGAAYTAAIWLFSPCLSLSVGDWVRWLRAHLRALAAGAAMIALALVVMWQNHPLHESPLLSAALLLAGAWGEDASLSPEMGHLARSWPHRAGLAAVLGIGLFTVALDASALARHSYMTHFQSSPVASFAGTPWEGIHLAPPEAASYPIKASELTADAIKQGFLQARLTGVARDHAYTKFLTYHEAARTAEGLEFLRAKAPASDVAFSYYHSNEFPALLHRPQSARTMQWWDYGRTFSPGAHPAAAEVMKDADWFLEPKSFPGLEGNSLADTISKTWVLYRPYVEANFQLVGEGYYWRYWRRREQAS